MGQTTEGAQPDANTQPETPPTDAGGQQAETPAAFTQEQLNVILQDRLARERRKNQEKYGDLDALLEAKARLDEIKTAEMTENEKLKQQIADLEAAQVKQAQQIEAARVEALRVKIAAAAGLPAVVHDRLKGETEEAIKADADAMIAALKVAPVAPNIDGAAGGTLQGAKPGVKLTPGERAIADKYGISYEDYDANKKTIGL
jgi:hypothetical protein